MKYVILLRIWTLLFRHHTNVFLFFGIASSNFYRIIQQVYLVQCLFECLQGGVAVIW